MTTDQKKEFFLETVAAHKAQVYRVCWGFTDSAHDVEDLFQEVMVNVWKGVEGFRNDAAVSTWLYRITVNTCVLWQKRKRKILEVNLDRVGQMPQAELPDIELPNPNVLALRRAIQQLKKIDRSIILLVLEGCSYQEIAEVTGYTVSNVGARINRIKSRIKEIMQKK